ncbi:cytochrome P450 [Streptomyces sp. I6]|nr:cytochrome P450 [Streptomyces sp. I6]
MSGRTVPAHPTARDRTRPFDPPPELAAIRGHAPVSRLRYPDGHTGWLVTGYDPARRVLADPRFSARSEFKRVPVGRPGTDPFYGRPALPGWLVDMDAPHHTRLRRQLMGWFTARRTRALTPRIEQIVDAHLEAMAGLGGRADLVERFALPVPSLVICELLGVPYTERAGFQRNSATLFRIGATAAEAAAAMGELDAFLTELTRHRLRVPGDDLLSVLATAGELSPAEVAGVGALLLSAGHETTSGSLGLGAFALLSHPGQRARLAADPSLAGNAVEELLRYLTIFHFGVPRSPLEDVALEGHTLRAGESVTVSLSAANHDPARFADPGRLDLTRSASGHLAFGHGAHQCIGQHLARAEMRVAFPALLARFPGLRLAVPPSEVPLGRTWASTGSTGFRWPGEAGAAAGGRGSGRRVPAPASPVPGLPELCVRAAAGHQFAVGAVLGDPAVLQYHHPVGVVGGVQPVGDGDHRSAEQTGQGPFHRPRGVRVEQCRRLVEDDDGRVEQQQPGQRQLLGPGRGSSAAPEPTRWSRPSSDAHSQAATARRARSRSAGFASGRAMSRLSARVPRNTWYSWVTRMTRWRRTSGGSSVRATPPRVTVPRPGLSIPARSRPRVDLPAPEGPTTASRSPGRMCRSTPRRLSFRAG